MSLAIRLIPETLRSLPAASIGAAYMGIGTELIFPARIVLVQNFTDALLVFSGDGINDHFVLPDGGFLLLDVATNQSHTQGFYIAAGTRLYVKEIGTPTTGAVYFSSFYGGPLSI